MQKWDVFNVRVTMQRLLLDMSFSTDFQCMFEMFIQLHPVPDDVKLLHLLEYERGSFSDTLPWQPSVADSSSSL